MLELPQRTGIGPVLIGVDLQGLRGRNHDLDEVSKVALDRAGSGSSEAVLEFRALLALVPGHPALAAQLGVGEAVEEPGQSPRGDMETGGEILAELEALEAV